MKRFISAAAVLLILICAMLPAGVSAAGNPVPKAKQAVVMVYSGIYYQHGELQTYDYLGRYSSGTAFGVYAEGDGALVYATNGHVVSDDRGNPYDFVYICVDGADVYDESTMVKCEILYVDNKIDVALIKAPAPISGVGTLPLMLSEELETGDQVYALGFPGIADEVTDGNNYTAEDITVTDGIISRYITSDGVKCMAHTATVNHGNSGGPLINAYGHAIGINTFINMDPSTADLRCYAIYIDYVVEAMDELGIPYELVSLKNPVPDFSQPVTPEPNSQSGKTEGTKAETNPNEKGMLSKETILIIVGAAALCVLLVVVLILVVKKKSDGAATKIQGPAVTVYAISGPLQGQNWQLGTMLVIGRDYGCNIVYPADTRGISRRHCRIERMGEEIVVTDLGSTYGTFIGGRKLPANVPVRVGLNTEIGLGGDRIKMLLR